MKGWISDGCHGLDDLNATFVSSVLGLATELRGGRAGGRAGLGRGGVRRSFLESGLGVSDR